MKNIRIFYLKICQFLVVKFSIYLNRRVFVMNNMFSWEKGIVDNPSYLELGKLILGISRKERAVEK